MLNWMLGTKSTQMLNLDHCVIHLKPIENHMKTWKESEFDLTIIIKNWFCI